MAISLTGLSGGFIAITIMIYLNNAATSFPKFPAVADTMYQSMKSGCSLGNRDSIDVIDAARQLFDIRRALSTFFGANGICRVSLQPSDTIALNIAIASLQGTVITSDMEHNSVMRPLVQGQKEGRITNICRIPTYQKTTEQILDSLQKEISRNRNIGGAVFTHASNVTGDVLPAKEIGELLYEYGIPFILDAAQSAGIVPIEIDKWHISVMTFAGHKALGGPQGTGGMFVKEGFPLKPILFGGTGNASSEIAPPISFPDSFEVGTPATHDILGLYTALKELKKVGQEEYAKKILGLTQEAYNRLSQLPNITVFGNSVKESSAISFLVKGHSCKEVGEMLGKHGIVCRTGAHCAAEAMKTMNLKDGTVRISFGYFNTEDDVNAVAKIIKDI